MPGKELAITIWVDESTDVLINNKKYNLIGYLITNSDEEEFLFLNKLKQARKEPECCWTTLHGREMKCDDTKKMGLVDRWLTCFKLSENVYFHTFLYKKNEKFISKEKTYEHYFAKQSVFSIANKMKKTGYTINTMFKDVSTITILFDRRRSHSASIVANGKKSDIKRINDLEDIYKSEIAQQITKISGKNSKTTELTVRFSFLSAECFDAIQFSDCLLYLIRHKIEQEQNNKENNFTRLFDKHFLNDLDSHTKSIGFKKIYEYDKKFNFFESVK